MPDTLKYLVDEKGQTTSVVVPVKLWDDLNLNYQKLQNKLAVFHSVKAGLEELKADNSKRKDLQRLKDFLK